MTIKLPSNVGYALRDAPVAQQKKILGILADWPSNVGQSTRSYSKALHKMVGKVVQA